MSGKHIASCSFGKDSLATILLAMQHGEPLDEVLYCEVMFDKGISGEVPEHRDFIYHTAIPAIQRMGIKVTVLRASKTYMDLFTGRITRGPKKGMLRAFPICGKCYVQRDCKLKPIRQYQKTLPPGTVQYIGIAADEPNRLLRLDRSSQVSLLEKYKFTEQDAKELCAKAGLLSPVYAFSDRGGCWFCPNAKQKELRHLYDHHPELWNRMLDLQKLPGKVSEKFNRTQSFSDIDVIFRREDLLAAASMNLKQNEVKQTKNTKYEITEIAHEHYPFLHRIRALRDIGAEVKAGDLGGFVERAGNLSFEADDNAWLFDDAISAGDAYVDRGSCLRDSAVACGQAYVSCESLLLHDSRAEDQAYIRGAVLLKGARVSASGMVLASPDTHTAPILSGPCAVYGKVVGDVHIEEKVIVAEGETVQNNSLDTLVLHVRGRTVIRDPSRDELFPGTPQEEKNTPMRREMTR